MQLAAWIEMGGKKGERASTRPPITHIIYYGVLVSNEYQSSMFGPMFKVDSES